MAEAGGSHGVQGQFGLYKLHLEKKKERKSLLAWNLSNIFTESLQKWGFGQDFEYFSWTLTCELQSFPQLLLTSRPGGVVSGFPGLWYYACMLSLIPSMHYKPQSQHAQWVSIPACTASHFPSLHGEPQFQRARWASFPGQLLPCHFTGSIYGDTIYLNLHQVTMTTKEWVGG